MASIDGNTCDVFRGPMLPPLRHGRRVERFGLAEIGHIAGALIPQVSTPQTVHYSATVQASVDLRKTLNEVPYKGPVTVIDGNGSTWADCVVESASITEARAVIDNGVPKWMVVVDWEISAPTPPTAPPPE